MARIGLIQVDNRMDKDITARQDVLISLAEKCLTDGADLVFFPEAFQYVYHREVIRDKDAFRKLSAEWQQRCAALAKKYNAYVVPWDYEIDEDGRIYNSSYILDRQGNFIGRYRKCNLTHGELEKGLTRGTDYPVFDLDIGRVGILICFDNYFPESCAALGNRGAQLVLYPLFGDTLSPQWEMKLRTRAIDHSLYMASCQLQPYWDKAYTGMIDKEGNVIARLDAINTYTVCEVELSVPVLTNTAVIENRQEDLREYLHKCRNPKAFTSLATEGTAPKEWDEIYKYD